MSRLCLILVLLGIGLPAMAATPPVTALTFSPDGKSVLAGSQSGLMAYDWPALLMPKRLATQVENVHDLAFSPDGKTLAVAGGTPGETGQVELLVWPEGNSLAVLAAHKDCVQAVVWKDDTLFASASLDHEIVLWDARTRQPVRRLQGHSRGVTTLGFLPGTPLLVSGSLDQNLRVWNSDTGELVRTLNNHTGEVRQLAVRPLLERQPLIASISRDRTVRFWQPAIGRMVRFVRLESPPLAAAWLPEGKQLAVTTEAGQLLLIDPADASIVQTVRAVDGWAYSLTVHPGDGSPLVGGREEIRRVRLSAPP